ncbi:hypothetical protein [Aureliella helgolandensis]|uniref:Uncharacterized protein n=1 Tax=Aureliella helgolandensis TaxID=2527968 RepID=A0A518GCL3_9BACT|nr:hypothetical protein [Aureliella helgolandensis]QDV26341.1 hypothetical protein Q31a_47140 [Aureliella helgolandensis]
MIRLINAINAAKKILVARQAWNEQDGPNIFWQGAQSKQISEAFDEAIRTACDSTADADSEVEDSARALLLCLDDVAYSHQKWLQDASMGLPTAPPRGSDQLHRVLDRLAEQVKQSSLPLPPPIEQLQKQKVSPNQIALIYGWKLEDGSPDAQKVFEEISKPGTHFKPKTWVHPAVKSIQAETDRRWTVREPRSRLFLLHSDGRPAGAEPSNPQIPSLDELLDVRAPVEQIMRLHQMTEEDVLEAARVAGVDLQERYI